MSALKAAIEAMEAFAADIGDLDLEIAKARALMHGYDAAWSKDAWQALPGTLESQFVLPIVNPDTNRMSRTFKHAGKRDGLAINHEIDAFRDGVFLLEHKTCQDRIDDPAAPYWQRLNIDAQVSGYSLACWQDGIKIAGTIYDVIRKPVIAISQVPILDADGLKIVVDANGVRAKNKNGSWKQSADKDAGLTLQSRDETVQEFEARLREDVLTRPQFYFARKVIWRTDRELLEFAYELWDVADEIREARANDRHYRNSGACLQWNRPCEYLPICSGQDDINSDRWQQRPLHTELPMVEGDGKDLLTNSRMGCFKQCRRKHYYRYELGLSRIDKEESKALLFGTMFHLGLEAFWNYRAQRADSSITVEQPAIA